MFSENIIAALEFIKIELNIQFTIYTSNVWFS